MDQVYIKYTNLFRCKTLRNLPKFWIFGLITNPLATLCLTAETSLLTPLSLKLTNTIKLLFYT
jgi:hypothetical protein